MDQRTRHKFNKEIVDFSNTLNHLVLINVYRTLHQTTAEYKFHETVSSMVNMVSHKKALINIKGLYSLIKNIFSDYNGIKFEGSKRRKWGKFTNMWKLSNTLLSKNWVKKKT